MYRFELPDIGEGVVEAEVVEWKVREGESVAEDQVLVVLMTDKAEIEIPSPRAGRVHRLGFAEGETLPVGAVLIEIDDGAQVESEPPAQREATTTAHPPKAPDRGESRQPPRMPARPVSQQRATPGGIRAVPAVRELARRLGVDLEQVEGTGPGGRVMRRDIEGRSSDTSRLAPRVAAPEMERAEDPEDWERQPLRGLRRAIAERMALARRRAAHFSYVEEIDLTRTLALRDRLAGEEAPLSPLAFVARAALRALPGFAMLNASIDDARQEIVLKKRIHLGIAVAARDGLRVPVIEDATELTTRQLAARIAELAERARSGGLQPSELRGSTFTITSLGKLGGIASTPILNPPEAAILGVNAVRWLPRYVGDALTRRAVMNLSMSVDHRIADGLLCAQFVQEVKGMLEEADFGDLEDARDAR